MSAPPTPVTSPTSPSPPLRIAHVVDVLALAGMEYGVVKLVNRLDPARFHSMIVCMRHQRGDVGTLLSPNVPVVEMHKSPGRNWRVIGRLARVFREARVDIVHSHNWSTLLYSALAARLAGVRVVVHGEHGKDDTAKHPQRLLASRILAKGVDRVLAVSRDLAEEVVRDWGVPPARVRWIPNGVDLDGFRAAAAAASGTLDALRAELGLAQGDIVIMNTGGFRTIKDHATLLRAFAVVRRAEPRARLVLIGQGGADRPRAGLDDEAAALGIGDDVRFPGVRTDVPRVLQLCDVYVNSSRYEGMSNTILEAMAAGKSVVATAVGGNPDLVSDGETGFLVPAGDPEAMAARILELVRDAALRRRMGSAGRERMEAMHSMPAMVRAYGDLYEELAGRARSG